MKYILDSHSHIQFPVYDIDRVAVIERAKSAGLPGQGLPGQGLPGQGVKMIAVGTQTSTSEAAIRLAHKYPEDVWATVGYHPNHAMHAQISQTERGRTQTNGWHHDKNEQVEAVPEKFDIKKMRELAMDSKVVAIGECGLDYFRLEESEKRVVKSLQKEVFLQQAELAKELNKPLMIHCRPAYVKTSAGKAVSTDDAYEDLYKLLITNNQSPITSVIHFYVGSPEITKKLVEAGFYFTFGGVITFARDYDESIKYIPLERILLETDCPYVAPAPYRGKRNEPAYITETAQKMAEIKNISLEKLTESVYKNTIRVFKIF